MMEKTPSPNAMHAILTKLANLRGPVWQDNSPSQDSQMLGNAGILIKSPNDTVQIKQDPGVEPPALRYGGSVQIKKEEQEDVEIELDLDQEEKVPKHRIGLHYRIAWNTSVDCS